MTISAYFLWIFGFKWNFWKSGPILGLNFKPNIGCSPTPADYSYPRVLVSQVQLPNSNYGRTFIAIPLSYCATFSANLKNFSSNRSQFLIFLRIFFSIAYFSSNIFLHRILFLKNNGLEPIPWQNEYQNYRYFNFWGTIFLKFNPNLINFRKKCCILELRCALCAHLTGRCTETHFWFNLIYSVNVYFWNIFNFLFSFRTPIFRLKSIKIIFYSKIILASFIFSHRTLNRTFWPRSHCSRPKLHSSPPHLSPFGVWPMLIFFFFRDEMDPFGVHTDPHRGSVHVTSFFDRLLNAPRRGAYDHRRWSFTLR